MFSAPIQTKLIRSGIHAVPVIFFCGLAMSLLGCVQDSDESLIGKYTLSKVELNLHCGGLETAIETVAARILSLQATVRSEDSDVAPSLARFWIRVIHGVGSDSPSLHGIGLLRERARSYNTLLKSKGCTPVDLESRFGS